jgi:subtilisin family serine protease
MSSEPIPERESSSRSWPGILLLIGVFMWVVGISVFSHALVWTAEQFVLVSGLNWPGWVWFVLSIGQALALLIPLGLLAAVWPVERQRGIYRAWALGAFYVLLMAPMRLVQPPAVIAANILQILLTFGALALLFLLMCGLGRRLGRPTIGRSIWLALLIAVLASYPWLLWGALGSPLDTILNFFAALLFGLLAGLILSRFLLQPLDRTGSVAKSNVLLGGLAGIALLIEMTSAFGFGGLQLVLMIVVPSFGLPAAAVYWFSGRKNPSGQTIPLAILVGLVLAAPVLLLDPDELTLILAVGGRDLLQWALYAAVATALVGWLSGLVLILFWPRVLKLYRHTALTAVALGSFAIGLLLFFAVGQPGFYGEQLFVILQDQADLTPASSIEEVDSRRTYVYETLVAHAETTQVDLRQDLDRFGIEYQPYYLVNGLELEGGPLLRIWLESRSEVDRVLDNPVLRPLRAPASEAKGGAEPPDSILWNQQLIGADRVWRDFSVAGVGIVVGQSDSGVDGRHPELSLSYRGRAGDDNYNWYDPWNDTGNPTDVGGHGTHTLGTILGESTGVAPGAEWIGCVNLARNLANPTLYLDCMQFMLAPFPQGGDPLGDGQPSLAADVLNNSWGCPPQEGCDPNALLDAARALRQAGIFVVVSAGNEGPFCESVRHPLAIYDEVFSVGAVDSDGLLAFFSSVGPVSADGSQRTKPDILAPGTGILSAFPDDSYDYLDGTSMAGPHVAGVVALMWSANPSLVGEIEQTEELLRSTASEFRGQLPDCGDRVQPPFNGIGYGIIDAYAAVEAAMALSAAE